jgi:threonyl-tRNA synthetase
MFVVGKREAEEQTVSIRRLGSQAQQTLPLTEAIKRISAEAIPPDLAREKDPSRREAA